VGDAGNCSSHCLSLFLYVSHGLCWIRSAACLFSRTIYKRNSGLVGKTDSKGADRGNNRLFQAFTSSNSRLSPGIYSMIEIDLAKYAVYLHKVGIDVKGMRNTCKIRVLRIFIWISMWFTLRNSRKVT